VCGTAWENAQTIVVEDVEAFPGHIACSAASKSEIVVPIKQNEAVIGVLDVDSEFLNHFDDIDQKYLEEVASIIAQIWK
jgi:GAF domain-containing protein